MNGTFTLRSPSTTNETSPSPESTAFPSMSTGWPMTVNLMSADRFPSPSEPLHVSVCFTITESPTNFLMASGTLAGCVWITVTESPSPAGSMVTWMSVPPTAATASSRNLWSVISAYTDSTSVPGYVNDSFTFIPVPGPRCRPRTPCRAPGACPRRP
jgi:hypothetical protein